MEICLMLAGAIISAIFGYLTQLYIERSKRTINYSQIKKHFQFNLDRLVQMEEQLTSKPQAMHPDYRLDLTVLDFLLSTGPKTFPSETQFEFANKCRFQLHHINIQLMFLFSFQSDSQPYLQTVLAHIRGEIAHINKILEET